MRQERLLEALLTLAQGEYGELKREPVDLAATAADVLRGYDHHPLRRVVTLRPAVTRRQPTTGRAPRGEPGRERHPSQHSERPARPRHAHHRRTAPSSRSRTPAQRSQRVRSPACSALRAASLPTGRAADGVGLGLAIVQAIADAHDATIHAEPRTGGGLRIDIGFPQLPVPRLVGCRHGAGAGSERLEQAAR